MRRFIFATKFVAIEVI